jgi:hypothetical protein
MEGRQNGELLHQLTQLWRHLPEMKTAQTPNSPPVPFNSLSVGAAQEVQGILVLHNSAARTEDATQNEQSAGRGVERERIGRRRSGVADLGMAEFRVADQRPAERR